MWLPCYSGSKIVGFVGREMKSLHGVPLPGLPLFTKLPKGTFELMTVCHVRTQ